MKKAVTILTDDQGKLPSLPAWATSGRGQDPEEAAFFSGAALAIMSETVGQAVVPQRLWRDRLALQAAEACVTFSGRVERSAGLRDEIHLLRPGDQPGPAGAVYQEWREAVARRISVQTMIRALPDPLAAHVPVWMDTGRGGPVALAAATFEAVRADAPHAASAALILADAVLARALGWTYLVPLLAAGLARRDLRASGDDLRLACHRAVVASVPEALRMAADLSRRASQLRMITPKLRAKGAGAAVEMILTRDAVTATSLPLPDRAARRLCHRLVSLGVARELTGRATFRLYGL